MAKYYDENGDLEFHFGDDEVTELDQRPELQNTVTADFAVNPKAEPSLLIEVKDPSTPGATVERRREWLAEMSTDDYMDRRLVQACTNSLAFMLAHEPGRTRYEFFAVLGMERMFELGFDAVILGPMQDYLRRQLRAPGTQPRVEHASLVTEAGWNDVLPQYPLRRVSTG